MSEEAKEKAGGGKAAHRKKKGKKVGDSRRRSSHRGQIGESIGAEIGRTNLPLDYTMRGGARE